MVTQLKVKSNILNTVRYMTIDTNKQTLCQALGLPDGDSIIRNGQEYVFNNAVLLYTAEVWKKESENT